MTQNAVTKCASATLFLLLVLLLLLALLSDAAYQFDQNQNLKETNIVFYMHDWQNGLNATAIPVGVRQPEEAVGGLKAYSARDSNDPALHLIFSVVFTNKEFNGSTLEIQGADKLFEQQREVSVVS
ncbi:hypothetical protein Q3G72_004404 [Acer saccharum]|nr:hypothetical protein Q3G72_004404 [Acer saccharum]